MFLYQLSVHVYVLVFGPILINILNVQGMVSNVLKCLLIIVATWSFSGGWLRSTVHHNDKHIICGFLGFNVWCIV